MITKYKRLQNYIDYIEKFSKEHFPESTVESKLLHLKEEINELIENPEKMEEWADVIILFLNAWGHNGLTSADLFLEVDKKMKINEKRKWSKPDENKVYRHIN